MVDASRITDIIGNHYARQATIEVWDEVDELRERVATLETLLRRALTEVGCLEEEKCPHWVEWHNLARKELARGS